MRKSILAFIAAGSMATPAFAHPGHDGNLGFSAGFAHPFSGLDHLLVMAAVGLWAGLVLRGKAWVWPAAFVIFMLAGFAYGAQGGAFPGVETIIAASLIGIGICLALNARPPVGLGAAIIAFFATAHGFAHGAEMPAGSNALAFAGGFASATALIHAAGLGIAIALMHWRASSITRIAGGGLAVAGVLFALAG